MVAPECHKMKDGVAIVKDGIATVDAKAKKPFFAFSRAAFGLVTIRTDGERTDLKEAYAFVMDDHGKPLPARVVAV